MFASPSANVRDTNPEPVPHSEFHLGFPIEPQGIVGLFDGDNDVWYWYSLNSGYLAIGPEGGEGPARSVVLPEELRPRTESEFETLVGAGGEDVPEELADHIREVAPGEANEILDMLVTTRGQRKFATDFEKYPRIGHALYVIDPRGFTVRANSSGVGFDTDLRDAARDDFTPVTTAEGAAYEGWGEQLRREENFGTALELATKMAAEHYRKKPADLDPKIIELMAKRFGPPVLHGFPSFEFAKPFAFEPGDTGYLGLNEWTYLQHSPDTPRGIWEQNGRRQEIGHWPFATQSALGRNDEINVKRGDQTFRVSNPDGGDELLTQVWVPSPSSSSVATHEAAAQNRAALGDALGALLGVAEGLRDRVAQGPAEPAIASTGLVIEGEVVDPPNGPVAHRRAIAPAAESVIDPAIQRRNRPGTGGSQGPR